MLVTAMLLYNIGVVPGVGMFLYDCHHYIHAEINIVSGDSDSLILVSTKDVSVCQGTLELYDAPSDHCGALEGCYI